MVFPVSFNMFACFKEGFCTFSKYSLCSSTEISLSKWKLLDSSIEHSCWIVGYLSLKFWESNSLSLIYWHYVLSIRPPQLSHLESMSFISSRRLYVWSFSLPVERECLCICLSPCKNLTNFSPLSFLMPRPCLQKHVSFETDIIRLKVAFRSPMTIRMSWSEIFDSYRSLV